MSVMVALARLRLRSASSALFASLGFAFVVTGSDSQRANQHSDESRKPELFHQRQNGFGCHDKTMLFQPYGDS
jgi:hypothetical protein